MNYKRGLLVETPVRNCESRLRISKKPQFSKIISKLEEQPRITRKNEVVRIPQDWILHTGRYTWLRSGVSLPSAISDWCGQLSRLINSFKMVMPFVVGSWETPVAPFSSNLVIDACNIRVQHNGIYLECFRGFWAGNSPLKKWDPLVDP